jgi:hypothetical protein
MEIERRIIRDGIESICSIKTKTYCKSSRLFLASGAEGDRTPDLMTASHALSQLSYSPDEQFSNNQKQ